MAKRIEVEVEAGRDAAVNVAGRDQMGEKREESDGKVDGLRIGDLFAALPLVPRVVEWIKVALRSL